MSDKPLGPPYLSSVPATLVRTDQLGSKFTILPTNIRILLPLHLRVSIFFLETEGWRSNVLSCVSLHDVVSVGHSENTRV